METVLATIGRLPALYGFIVQMAVIVLLSFMLRWFWKNVLVRISLKTATNFDRILFTSTVGAVQYTFLTAGLSFTWNLYGDSVSGHFEKIPWMSAEYLRHLVDNGVYFALAFSIVYLAAKVLFGFIEWFETDIATRTETTLDEKIAFSLRKFLKGLIIVLVIMIVADHLEWQINKIWAAAGIGSLAVALAAKDTFANMISGIIILFDRPFLVGDRVELADGTYGDVVDIGLRSTKILSFDNTIHIIPNQDVSNQRITNHSYPDQNLKVALKLGVAYGSDMHRVKQVLNDILARHPKVRNEPPWGIWFTEFGDSSLNIFIRFWIDDYRQKFDIVDEINMEINRCFAEDGIEIPFPQSDIHIITPGGMPPMNA